MGPIALLDFIGPDVAVSIGDALGHDVPQIIRDQVAIGAFGKKTRSGLYPCEPLRRTDNNRMMQSPSLIAPTPDYGSN